MSLFNMKIGGAGGASASIFAYGDLQSTDTVYAEKDGKRINGVWQTKQTLNPDWHGLPAEYQEVEYLESTGEQWIDTGVARKKDWIWKIKCKFLIGRSNYGCLEVRNGKYLRTHLLTNNDEDSFSLWQSFDSDVSSYVENIVRDTYYNIVFAKNFVEVNNNVEYASIPYDHEISLWLFKRNRNSGTDSVDGSSAICYSAILDETGNEIQNLFPCYRISDHKPGMYDTVNGVFYINQGTGADFLIGDDVPQYLTEQGFVIAPILEYGTWQLVASNGTTTETIDVLIDAAEEFDVEVTA